MTKYFVCIVIIVMSKPSRRPPRWPLRDVPLRKTVLEKMALKHLRKLNDSLNCVSDTDEIAEKVSNFIRFSQKFDYNLLRNQLIEVTESM